MIKFTSIIVLGAEESSLIKGVMYVNKCKYWDKDTGRCFGVREPFYCSGNIYDCTEEIGKEDVGKIMPNTENNFDFFKEFARMCHSYEHDCHECPLGAMYLCPNDLYNHLEETKNIINIWSVTHKEADRIHRGSQELAYKNGYDAGYDAGLADAATNNAWQHRDTILDDIKKGKGLSPLPSIGDTPMEGQVKLDDYFC